MGAIRVVVLGAALACSSSCGASDGLKKLEDVMQVAAGGIDPSLLGTFRVDDPRHEAPRVMRLLVLRKDGTFHGEMVRSCADGQGCTSVPVDGSYTQVRAMPDPGRASGVTIRFFVDEGGDAGLSYLRMTLKRALVAHSPQVSLYHESSAAPSVPYFQLEHPLELWCAADADCSAQALSSPCDQACAAGQCACR
ncbi:MAG TPA: hypothetical protein VGK67_13350 [Myxococcales bacterium]|jgi:hypothetical protein